MTAAEAGQGSERAKVNPEALVLRGRPRPVVRFRRGLIVGIAGAASASLVSLAWFALDPPGIRSAAHPGEVAEPLGKAPAEALAGAPASYGDVPRLGPPLPGDLGRPILESRRELEAAEPVRPVAPGADARAAERQRRASEELAARSSGVMVSLARPPASEPPVRASAPAAAEPGAAPDAAVAPAAELAGQSRKIAFARTAGGNAIEAGVSDAPSPWTLAAGTVIPASLVTGLNSDLPGMVIAQVTENVVDSATGRTVLIPQGARLLGRYDSMVAYGQRRALLVWDRLLFPDGSSASLDNMPAADTSGYSGVSDRVDSHGLQLLKGIVLSTLLGVGAQLSLGGGGELARAIRQSAQQGAAHAGDQLVSHDLEVQPTLVVRPGWRVTAIVHKDLVLRPWRG